MAIEANSGARVGDYILLKKLGEGGMAEVWLARHQASAQLRALKFLNPQFQNIPEVEARFQSEGENQLVHPNIVRIYEVGQIDGSSFLAMAFIDGRDLEKIMDSRRGPLTVPEAVDIGMQVLAGLGYAHANGIVHRDIKPSNVLVDSDGQAYLMDFGIAKATRTARNMTQVNQRLGTPDYMSPEQIRNPRDVDSRSDIYSFGCMFYELLTGSPPFDRNAGYESEFDIRAAHLSAAPIPPVERRSNIPALLNAITLHCLAKAKEDRPQSCGEIIDQLNAYRLAVLQQQQAYQTTPVPNAQTGPRPYTPPTTSAPPIPVYEPTGPTQPRPTGPPPAFSTHPPPVPATNQNSAAARTPYVSAPIPGPPFVESPPLPGIPGGGTGGYTTNPAHNTGPGTPPNMASNVASWPTATSGAPPLRTPTVIETGLPPVKPTGPPPSPVSGQVAGQTSGPAMGAALPVRPPQQAVTAPPAPLASPVRPVQDQRQHEPQDQRPRNRTGLLIAVGSVVLLAALGGGGWMYFHPAPKTLVVTPDPNPNPTPVPKKDNIPPQTGGEGGKSGTDVPKLPDQTTDASKHDHPGPVDHPVDHSVDHSTDKSHRNPGQQDSVIPPPLQQGVFTWTGNIASPTQRMVTIYLARQSASAGSLAGAAPAPRPMTIKVLSGDARVLTQPDARTSYSTFQLALPAEGQQTVQLQWKELPSPAAQ